VATGWMACEPKRGIETFAGSGRKHEEMGLIPHCGWFSGCADRLSQRTREGKEARANGFDWPEFYGLLPFRVETQFAFRAEWRFRIQRSAGRGQAAGSSVGIVVLCPKAWRGRGRQVADSV